MRILITSGGTVEAIDQVRFITNFSTGKTGARIAEALIQQGCKVILLKGQQAVGCASPACEQLTFTSFLDLDRQMQKLLRAKKFDLVIHLAAVSDYSVSSIQQSSANSSSVKKTRKKVSHKISQSGKINSQRALTIHLKKNFKIIDRLKSYSKNPFYLVGFKLTYADSLAEQMGAVRKLSKRSGVDLVVHNDLKTIRSSGRHQFNIFKDNELLERVHSPESLAQNILGQCLSRMVL
jgi:phosphopantothenoylcysteine decarboxylase/phosphopantothenate--cysteine ligase